MHNYERVLVLEDICEENSPTDFVVILGAVYSSSQKHDKYIFHLHQNTITDENKEEKKKNRTQGCLTSQHACKR